MWNQGFEFETGDEPAPERRPGRFLAAPRAGLAFLRYWAPVWLPCVLFVQIALLGLRPALLEGDRLEREEQALMERHDALLESRDQLERACRAELDPMYRARLERIDLRPVSDL